MVDATLLLLLTCSLTWLVTQKWNFSVGFPSSISTRLFVSYITCTLKRPSLHFFRFKISKCFPFLHIFDRFRGFLIKKGTCHITKKCYTDGGNPNNFFWMTSHFNNGIFCFELILYKLETVLNFKQIPPQWLFRVILSEFLVFLLFKKTLCLFLKCQVLYIYRRED